MPITGPDAGCLDAGRQWRGEHLAGARLILRRPVEADIPVLVELAGDWEVARHTAFIPHPYGEDDARTFVAEAPRQAGDGAHVVFALERRTEPGLIGCAGLIIDGDGAGAEIGYWIGRPHWGQGFAAEAVRRLLRLAFATLGLARVHAEVLADNPASGRVLEKAGFDNRGEAVGDRGRCQDQTVIAYEIDHAAWLAQEAAKPQVLVAAAALVDADGRVLLARRPEGKSMAGLWEFPGGKVAVGETPEAALVRELAEELAVDITESCLAPVAFASYPYDDFHLLMPLYVCRVWQGAPVPQEGQLLKWVRPTAMAGMPMPPADTPLVAALRDLL
jgi:8-oxo-dGTP diphosphatase